MSRLPCLLLCVLLACLPLRAQNCSQTSVGFTPLTELATGTWMGLEGGLYPGGTNTPPPAHLAAAMDAAAAIGPLDPQGAPDPAGHVVLLSIGMSNTTQEFATWVPISDADPNRGGSVVVVDGAQGGQDIAAISDPNAPFWQNVVARLAARGVTPRQVQAVWFKEAEAHPQGTVSGYASHLRDLFIPVMGILLQKYPNLQLCYASSRIYAGYATSALNPEPYAYASGFAVRGMIEEQINGNPALNHDVAAGPRVAPVLLWGPYTWADGLVPRADGLTWECQDFQPDGTHPSPSGRQKVATMLQAFFTHDGTATPWYLGPGGPDPVAQRILYGSGCPGAVGIPDIVTNGLPWLGNPGFAVGITHARPFAPATLFVSLVPAAIPVGGGCIALVSPAPGDLLLPSQGLPTTLSVSPAGTGHFSFPLGVDPAVAGVSVYAQWAVVDSAGAMGFALTRGLHLVFGHP